MFQDRYYHMRDHVILVLLEIRVNGTEDKVVTLQVERSCDTHMTRSHDHRLTSVPPEVNTMSRGKRMVHDSSHQAQPKHK